MKKTNKNRGFTLIEILVVIGLIAILAAVVLIAINPAKQFAQARNSQRTANVNAILNAIGQRIADNKGTFEGTFEIDGTTYTCPVLPTGSPADVGTLEASGNGCLVPTYIPALPTDPTWNEDDDGDNTLYKVVIGKDCDTPPNSAPGRVSVSAPEADLEDALPTPLSVCVVR